MKKLFIIRHAKSDWSIHKKDFDRPLSERGKRDAPKMAKYLKEQNIKIDQFISSTAERAKATCNYFAQEYQSNNIILEDILYMASPKEISSVIKKIDDSVENAAIFSHNNGLSYFVNKLTKQRIEHVPTCSVVGFEIATDSWSDFEKIPKEFLFFYYPKMFA